MTARVHSITSVNIAIVKTDPPGLEVHVEGQTVNPGWSGFELSYFVYIVPPADGIYEADMIGIPPGTRPDVLVPFTHDETRTPFPDDLKGLKVYSATNSVTAMLP